jgi:predicted cytidylate kinase
MRIALNGDLGSGKSTIGKRLAAELGVPFVSTGVFFREIGMISNMDALRTNLAAENNAEIDFAVDEKIRELDRTTQDFVIDSRMAWHFVRDATKVFLSTSPETAGERIMSDASRASETYATHAEAVRSLRDRRQSERKRYKKLYGVDIEDIDNYDLVIITDGADVADVVRVILSFAERRADQKFWIPKARLVPMIAAREAAGAPSSRRFGPGDQFFLHVCVKQNFGFFFGRADDLVSAFLYAGGLVPYVDEGRPASLPAERNLVELAQQKIGRRDIAGWEKLGNVKLDFAARLANNSGQVS